MESSPRPKPNPRRGQMTKSKRPKPRPDDLEAGAALSRAMRHSQPDKLEGKACGGKVKKMADGGMCRGMGAATKGGRFSRSG